MDSVHRRLWVTDIDTAQSHDTSKFDTVVSVCQDTCEDNISDETNYYHYPLADDCESKENWGGVFEYDTFSDAVYEVVQALMEGQTVLVHCHKGRNRSVSVCIGVYAIWRDVQYCRAKTIVFESRPEADPNTELLAFARHAAGTAIRGDPR